MTPGQWQVMILADIIRRVGRDESFALKVRTRGGSHYEGPWKQHGQSILQINEWYIDFEQIEAIALGDPL